jgi:hypothetical protein
VLPNYNKHEAVINARLQTMFKNGQRRLRTAIPPPANLVGRSPDDAIDMTYKRNVEAFLGAVKQNGFEEIEVGIGSVGEPPTKWTEWHENLYLQRWGLIMKLRPLLVASGLHYYTDLLNEGLPASNQPMLLRYTQRLWADYTKSFGKKDTIGFSIIATVSQDRYKQIPKVYGTNLPEVFDLHIYDNSYASFVNAHTRMKALGVSKIPWIIGEAFYNDSKQADDLSLAIRITQQQVLFLLEWPLTRAKQCDDVDVVPLAFDEYIKRGF